MGFQVSLKRKCAGFVVKSTVKNQFPWSVPGCGNIASIIVFFDPCIHVLRKTHVGLIGVTDTAQNVDKIHGPCFVALRSTTQGTLRSFGSAVAVPRVA